MTVTATDAQVARVQRCLVVLGFICEHSRKCVDILRQGSLASSIGQNGGGGHNDYHAPDQDPTAGKASGKKGKTRKSQEQEQEEEQGQDASSSSSAPGYGLATEGGDDEDAAATRLSDLPALTAHTLNGCCYAAVQFALAFASPQVQARAVQALCGVFIGCPRLMLRTQESGLLTRILSHEFPESVHERMLVALKDMMMAEEHRLEDNAAMQVLVTLLPPDLSTCSSTPLSYRRLTFPGCPLFQPYLILPSLHPILFPYPYPFFCLGHA